MEPTEALDPPTSLSMNGKREEAEPTGGFQPPTIYPVSDLTLRANREDGTLGSLQPEPKKDPEFLNFEPFNNSHLIKPLESPSKDNLSIEHKLGAGSENWKKMNPPRRRRIPGRKRPRWLPDQDDKPWKVWDYPDMQEYSSSEESDEEEVFPPGTVFKGHGVDDSTFDFLEYCPKWCHNLTRYMACFFIIVNTLFAGSMIRDYWKKWVAKKLKKDEDKDPERMPSSSESD